MKASLLVRAAPAVLIAGLLGAGPAVPALAQAGSPATSPAPTPSTGGAAPAPGTRQPEAAMHNDVEQRIADLHARMHITPAQSKEWNAFAQVMRENARDLDRAYRLRAEHLASQTALQNLESYARLEQTRARDVERLVPAFRALYHSLSAQQKRDTDELFRSFGRRHESQEKPSPG